MKMNAMKDMDEMMKKEMMKKMEMMKAETDPEKMEMMKKEMMANMKNMDPMMKKEMMKKMEMAMKEYGSMNAQKDSEAMHKMDSKGTEGGAKKDADMSKVKDAPKPKEGMKAVANTKQVSENRRYLQTKPGSLEEAVLISRGLVEKK
jgi:Zn-dependent metalloprotease